MDLAGFHLDLAPILAFAGLFSKAVRIQPNDISQAQTCQILLCGTHCLMTPKANMNSDRHKVGKKSGQSRAEAKAVIRRSCHAVFASRFRVKVQNGINHKKWQKPDIGV